MKGREMTEEDFPALCKILQDEEVMYAYAHAFSDEEAAAWLENQFKRYRTFGNGLWAVVLKENGEMIGQCGLTWHHGYAAEAAIACREYAFERLPMRWDISLQMRKPMTWKYFR